MNDDSWLFESCESSIVNPRETLNYDPYTQITHPTLLRQDKDTGSSYLVTSYDTIVLEVTAMVNHAGTCSMAVSFGAQSRYNKRGVKDACDMRTGTCFVIYEALTLALKASRESIHPVSTALIMLDQAWFVDALSNVLRKSLISAPQDIILRHIGQVMQQAARQGLKTKFWVVESCTNTAVDRMAVDALPEDILSSPITDPAPPSPLISHERDYATRDTSARNGILVESPESWTTDDIPHLALDKAAQ